jgi:hypothetical protein
MKTSDLRAEARLSITQRASLSSGGDWFPCMVLDMSDKGFLLMSSRDVVVGQVLEFKCELFAGKVLECKLEIRHIGDAGVGTKIVEIDQKAKDISRLFLQEQYSGKLNQSG